ncbi:predicted protein [Brucella sp. NVSL 07-0026]|uniref:Uncharacterized protein n=1 Tax=Brucella pinnipedialis M292/94/1 TaxID=520462 RepID=A0A0E1X187_9HYPH|nr:predicted protein [Brucella pinnipedialis M292/94/1]EFG37650.1 predicted protein [Brucella sp. NVSL 07-0026]
MAGEVFDDRLPNAPCAACHEDGAICNHAGFGIIQHGKRFLIGILRSFHAIPAGKKQQKMMRDAMTTDKL